MAEQTVEESSWAGLIRGHREPPETVKIRMPLRQSHTGVAGSFQIVGTDGRHWWVKPPHQGELDWALTTEFVVSRAGAMIGAPTCRSAVIEITRDFDGWEYRRGGYLREGLGHGMEEVESAKEERSNLRYRTEDDNKSRQAGIYALYDWCWGRDEQWLHSTTNDMTIYSHDHGWYLPPSGPKWDTQLLRDYVDLPHPLPQSSAGLHYPAVEAVARELEKIDKSLLAAMLRRVPGAWPVSDAELETLGWFLERRAPAVAARMRALV